MKLNKAQKIVLMSAVYFIVGFGISDLLFREFTRSAYITILLFSGITIYNLRRVNHG